MTLLNASALYLASAAGLILLLHFLRARERRCEVSALFLWEGLRGDPQSRAARLWQKLDLLLILQLSALLSLVFALAQPAKFVSVASLSQLAVVIDGSASMRTSTGDGNTRYDWAIEEAMRILDRYPSTPTAVVQLSSRPQILSFPEASDVETKAAIHRSAPSFYGDGTLEDLNAILSGLGGIPSYERILLLTDHPFPGIPPSMETVLVSGGTNRAITAFTVREQATEGGTTAFVEVCNYTDEYEDARIRISDGTHQTSLSILLMPEGTEQYVVPFPSSRGTLFTATLDPGDDFEVDDVRYCALSRPLDLRVRWIGALNRYLLAALESVTSVTLVEEGEPSDLTIAYGEPLPSPTPGNVLLIHAGMDGYVALGEEIDASGAVEELDPSSPLLAGIEGKNLRIQTLPVVEFEVTPDVLLRVDHTPLLAVWSEKLRTITLLAADLMRTNLPILVDFPLFMRNYLSGLMRMPAELTYEWSHTGDSIELGDRGSIQELRGPDGVPVGLPENASTFRPDQPGHYLLVTTHGAYPVAVNVPSTESTLRDPDSAEALLTDSDRTTLALVPLWPYLAGIAMIFLLAEGLRFAGRGWRFGRERQ